MVDAIQDNSSECTVLRPTPKGISIRSKPMKASASRNSHSTASGQSQQQVRPREGFNEANEAIHIVRNGNCPDHLDDPDCSARKGRRNCTIATVADGAGATIRSRSSLAQAAAASLGDWPE